MAVQRIDHPLVQHKITLMRDKMTGPKEFRELVAETAMLMCYEATRDLPTKEIEIATPMGVAKSKIISGRKLAFVPILRAGLGMMDGLMTLVLAAKAVVTALAENTLGELESYEKTLEVAVPLPITPPEGTVLVPECWLSTENMQCTCAGGTLEATITVRAEDAVRILQFTGADMAMIGRGCFGNPWLFQQAQAALEGRPIPPLPPLAERWDTAVRQIELAVEDKGEHIALLEARKQLCWYLKGVSHANYYKEQIVRLTTLEELYRVAAGVRRDLR